MPSYRDFDVSARGKGKQKIRNIERIGRGKWALSAAW
jgi:hypothetical protein